MKIRLPIFISDGVVVTIVAVWCGKQGIAGSSLYITRELQDEIGFTVEHLN